MKILNLGCGTKTSASPDVINIDWSMYLRLRKNPLLRRLAPFFLRGERLRRFRALPENILVHNLARGLPFPDGSVDVVYHSHVLEHLDRDVARTFQREVLRVLRAGGLQRIVVPDLEALCRAYLSHIADSEQEAQAAAEHDAYVAAMIEQCVRREGYGTRRQRPLRRWVENLVLGDARRRGETHQWMYDRINLAHLLRQVGFQDPTVHTFQSSSIPGWGELGLDVDEAGRQYKKNSLYMEARK